MNEHEHANGLKEQKMKTVLCYVSYLPSTFWNIKLDIFKNLMNVSKTQGHYALGDTVK